MQESLTGSGERERGGCESWVVAEGAESPTTEASDFCHVQMLLENPEE